MKIFTQSAADFLDEWFESEELKVTLATDGVIGANGGPRSPGTAYILLHHCMGGVNGHRGLWGFVRGGMGGVSNAIADSARAHGATLRTSAPVEKILVKNGRAHGVALKNGDVFEAKIIASNLDPRRTFLKLLDAADLDPDFRDSIGKFRSEGTSLKDEPRPQRPARRSEPSPSSPARSIARPCTSVLRRVHRARLGRCQVRTPPPATP